MCYSKPIQHIMSKEYLRSAKAANTFNHLYKKNRRYTSTNAAAVRHTLRQMKGMKQTTINVGIGHGIWRKHRVGNRWAEFRRYRGYKPSLYVKRYRRY